MTFRDTNSARDRPAIVVQALLELVAAQPPLKIFFVVLTKLFMEEAADFARSR